MSAIELPEGTRIVEMIFAFECVSYYLDGARHCPVFIMTFMLDRTEPSPVHAAPQFFLKCERQKPIGSLGQTC